MVDDDLIVHRIVERLMGKIDSSLIFIPCNNGKVGLEKLYKHYEDSSEYIIILDLNMSVMDGWRFLDKIQSSQLVTYHNISLYILSSSTDKSDLEKAQDYACVKKFYHKPLNIPDIKEILTKTK